MSSNDTKRTDAVDFTFEGAADFRWRLMLATILSKSLHIGNIRKDTLVHEDTATDDAPVRSNGGMTNAEVTFLEMLRKLMPGSTVRYNAARHWVIFRPTVVSGGLDLEFDCTSAGRALTWFLEPLAFLLLFAQAPHSRVTLRGATADGVSVNVDTYRTATITTLKALGVDASLVIRNRGAVGASGREAGRVELEVSSVRSGAELKICDWLKPGQFKGVYGVAWATGRMNRALGLCVRGAEATLRAAGCPFVTMNDRDSAKSGSRAFGVTLFAQSTSGALVSADAFLAPTSGDFDAAEVGRTAALRLLDEISGGGCVDRHHVPLLLTLMAMGPPDYARVRTGPLSSRAVAVLRLLNTMMGIRFAVKTDAEILAESRMVESRAAAAGADAAEAGATDQPEGAPTVVLTCTGRAVIGAQTYY